MRAVSQEGFGRREGFPDSWLRYSVVFGGTWWDLVGQLVVYCGTLWHFVRIILYLWYFARFWWSGRAESAGWGGGGPGAAHAVGNPFTAALTFRGRHYLKSE